jgi:hypothetical protein
VASLKSDETELVPPTGIRKQLIRGQLAKAFEVNRPCSAKARKRQDRSLSAQSGKMPNRHCLQINIFQTAHLDALIKLLRDRIRTCARDS